MKDAPHSPFSVEANVTQMVVPDLSANGARASAAGSEVKLQVIDRGTEEYSTTLSLQNQLVETRIADRKSDDILVLVEHEPVYTTGRGVDFQTIPGEKGNVRWIEVGRGGEATFHGIGQLVGYPIFDLNRYGSDVHRFLRMVEEALIRALGSFGVDSTRRKGLTGVWVGSPEADMKKIASIGVGVRKWVSFHGFALNVSTDLDYFKAISPCGQSGEVMTSLAEVIKGGACPNMDEVKVAVAKAFEEVFSITPRTTAAETIEHNFNGRNRPPWLKVKAPGSPEFLKTQGIVKQLKLHTVCEEAICPNMGECWSHGTATFMILGDLCTRRCSFCSVKDGTLMNLEPLDPFEPVRVGGAVKQLGLKHVVITSVNRDDIEDMGAEHFDKTVRAIHEFSPDCRIELLIPDMQGRKELLQTILQSGLVDVLNHNVETVPRLYREVRPGANLKRSLKILQAAHELDPRKESATPIKTKSGLMVGLGEERAEVLEVMDILREAGCNILTIGQYLQPTPKQLPVKRFVTPEEFEDYRLEGVRRGFSYVESGPLVRSSYHAWRHSES